MRNHEIINNNLIHPITGNESKPCDYLYLAWVPDVDKPVAKLLLQRFGLICYEDLFL